MRLSLIKADSGYNPYLAYYCTVFLDDVKAGDVVTADEEKGYALRISRGQQYEWRGRVRIDIPDGVKADAKGLGIWPKFQP